jgi:hypothetical protein
MIYNLKKVGKEIKTNHSLKKKRRNIWKNAGIIRLWDVMLKAKLLMARIYKIYRPQRLSIKTHNNGLLIVLL